MAQGPGVGFEGLLPAAPPQFSLLTIPGVLVTDAEKAAGAPAGDPPEQAVMRWENGVTVEPEGCGIEYDLDLATADYPYWWRCEGDNGRTPVEANVNGTATKYISGPPDVLTFTPYTILAGYSCSAPDAAGPRRAQVEARALRRLNAITPGAVEHELWTGEVSVEADFGNPYLANPAEVTVLNAAGFGYVTALAEMEDALRECGNGQKIIHAEARVVTTWAAEGLVQRDVGADGRPFLRTFLGTFIAVGTGYPGTGPEIGGGSSEGIYSDSYIYGTGMVRVFLGEPVARVGPAEAIDRTDNDYVIRYERQAVAVFDHCCLLGTGVRLCDRLCGSGS